MSSSHRFFPSPLRFRDLLGACAGFALLASVVAALGFAQDPAALPAKATASEPVRPHPFDDPELDALMTLLDGDVLRHYRFAHEDKTPGYDLLDVFQFHLRSDQGPAIRDEAMRRLVRGHQTDREKAMFLLAHFDDVPAEFVQRMQRSMNLEQAIWGRFCTQRQKRSSEHSQAHWLEDRIHRTWRGDLTPLLACKPELIRRLRASEEDLARWEASDDPDVGTYARGYYETFLPNLLRIEDFVHTAELAYVDIDGDGLDELFLQLAIPDGWLDWAHSIALKPHADGSWSVLSAYQLEENCEHCRPTFQACDLNGDGLPEVLEWMRARGMRAGTKLTVHSTTSPPQEFQGRHLTVMAMPGSTQAMLVRGSEDYQGALHFAYHSKYTGTTFDERWQPTETVCLGRSLWE